MKKMLLFLLLLFIPFFVNAEKIVKEEIIAGGFYNLMDVVKDKEGNYYLSGYNNYGLIEKYNADRELVVSKMMSEYEDCYSIAIDDDENLYAMCDKEVMFEGFNIPYINDTIYDNIYTRTELVKLDKQLNVIKMVDFLKPYDISDSKVIEYKDNYLYVIGFENEFGESVREDNEEQCFNYLYKNVVYKMDLDGNIIFKKDYSVAEQPEEKCYRKATSISDGYGLAFDKLANIIFKDHDIYFNEKGVYKYSDTGNKKWGLSNIEAYKMATTNEGNFVVGHIERDGNEKNLLFSAIDSDGEIKEEKKFSVTGNISVLSIDNHDSGYYVTFGIYNGNIEGINNGENGSFLVKYDYNFNIKDVLKLDYTPFYTKILDDGLYMFEWEILSKITSDFSGDEYAETTIKTTEVLPINDLFGLGLDKATWSIDDPSIIEIKDGIIIPKKIGSTVITTVYGDKSYKINIIVTEVKSPEEDQAKEVKEEEKHINPETKDFIIIIIIIFLLSFVILQITNYIIRRRQRMC